MKAKQSHAPYGSQGSPPVMRTRYRMSILPPKQGSIKIEKVQKHETGGILGVRGIVYEPINEQGVILLFAALCHDLGFMIEGIRKRKNSRI
jgi:hypothetical protein